MTGLKIRSEAAPRAWQPRAASADGQDIDDTTLLPLASEVGAALSVLFGLPVSAQPGQPLPPGAPEVAPELAGLLATIRLGGQASRRLPHTDGVVTARHGRLVQAALAPVAARHWPAGSTRSDVWLDIIAMLEEETISGPVRLLAPDRPVALPAPPAGHAGFIAGLPQLVRVELAGQSLPLARLLPLSTGQVIPLAAQIEMPLRFGDHQLGHARLEALPDGRQQAIITQINLVHPGDRP